MALCLAGGGKGNGTDVERDHTSLGAKISLTQVSRQSIRSERIITAPCPLSAKPDIEPT